MALAAALMQDEVDLPKEEDGRGPALPEIGQGDSPTPAEFASVLRHADTAAASSRSSMRFLALPASERDRERYGREVRCDLVLLIDQLDELFAVGKQGGTHRLPRFRWCLVETGPDLGRGDTARRFLCTHA